MPSRLKKISLTYLTVIDLIFDLGTGDIRESDNEKMKIEVSLDVDRDSLTSGEVVLSTATVNVGFLLLD